MSRYFGKNRFTVISAITSFLTACGMLSPELPDGGFFRTTVSCGLGLGGGGGQGIPRNRGNFFELLAVPPVAGLTVAEAFAKDPAGNYVYQVISRRNRIGYLVPRASFAMRWSPVRFPDPTYKYLIRLIQSPYRHVERLKDFFAFPLKYRITADEDPNLYGNPALRPITLEPMKVAAIVASSARLRIQDPKTGFEQEIFNIESVLDGTVQLVCDPQPGRFFQIAGGTPENPVEQLAELDVLVRDSEPTGGVIIGSRLLVAPQSAWQNPTLGLQAMCGKMVTLRNAQGGVEVQGEVEQSAIESLNRFLAIDIFAYRHPSHASIECE